MAAQHGFSTAPFTSAREPTPPPARPSCRSTPPRPSRSNPQAITRVTNIPGAATRPAGAGGMPRRARRRRAGPGVRVRPRGDDRRPLNPSPRRRNRGRRMVFIYVEKARLSIGFTPDAGRVESGCLGADLGRHSLAGEGVVAGFRSSATFLGIRGGEVMFFVRVVGEVVEVRLDPVRRGRLGTLRRHAVASLAPVAPPRSASSRRRGSRRPRSRIDQDRVVGRGPTLS